jgi:hypothetical protein
LILSTLWTFSPRMILRAKGEGFTLEEFRIALD